MTVPDAFRATADLMTVEMPLVTRAGVDAASSGRAGGRASAAVPTRHVAHIPITVSIGVAVFPDHGIRASELLEAADAALYAAKNAGRDTYRIAAAPVRRAPEPAADPTVPASDPATPVQRSDHDPPVTGDECPAATVVDADGATPTGGASTTGPPPRASIGR
jgi:hypothetical protein